MRSRSSDNRVTRAARKPFQQDRSGATLRRAVLVVDAWWERVPENHIESCSLTLRLAARRLSERTDSGAGRAARHLLSLVRARLSFGGGDGGGERESGRVRPR